MASTVTLVNPTQATIALDDSVVGAVSIPAFSCVEFSLTDYAEAFTAGLTVVPGTMSYADRRAVANALRHAPRLAAGSVTPAELDTDASQGANAALIFTADGALVADNGWKGNYITIAYTLPADADEAVALALSCTFTPGEGQAHDSYALVAQLGVDTDGSTVVTTADDLKTAIAADDQWSALVSAADKAANDGSGLLTAMAAASLSGGSGKAYVRNAG
jgi:hypothetical protein